MPTLVLAIRDVRHHLGAIRKRTSIDPTRPRSNYHLVWTPELESWFAASNLRPPTEKIEWEPVESDYQHRFKPVALRLTFETDQDLVLFKLRWC